MLTEVVEILSYIESFSEPERTLLYNFISILSAHRSLNGRIPINDVLGVLQDINELDTYELKQLYLHYAKIKEDIHQCN